MLRAKLYSSAALLAMGIFALTPSVQAQHHGGGGHGGGGHGGGHVSSGAHWSGGHGSANWSGGHNAGHWSGGGVHHGGYHYGYRPYYGYGYWPYYAFGLGSYLLPYANSYSNSYYSAPYSYDSGPSYDTYSDQSYVTPSYTYPSAQPSYSTPELVVPAALNQARLEVIVPDPNAEIWIQGAKTTTTGTRRVYVSPALSTGASYTYTVKGAWSRNGGMVTEQRNVPVTAGATAVIDFTRPAAARAQ